MQYSPVSKVLNPAVQQTLNPPKGHYLQKWKRFSHYLGGFRPNEITLLCAPTGTGKTSLLAGIAAQLVTQNIPTFAAPVETGDVDFAQRVIQVLSRTDCTSGEEISPDDLKRKAGGAIVMLSKSPLYISHYDNRVDPKEMLAVLDHVHRAHGVQVALLDNLNFFLEVVSQNRAVEVMDAVIHDFVMFLKKTPMHILLVVHPKKTDGGRVMSEFDIKGSSTAVQECANVLLFNRPKREQIESHERNTTDREFVFKKIRKRGRFVDVPIWMNYDGFEYRETLV